MANERDELTHCVLMIVPKRKVIALPEQIEESASVIIQFVEDGPLVLKSRYVNDKDILVKLIQSLQTRVP